MNNYTNPQHFLAIAKKIQTVADDVSSPPDEGFRCETQKIIPMSVVRDTRGYIEKVANQINGCYEKGWFDGCAVMTRRLIETLIIESFESHSISQNIKNTSGEFFYLKDLIDKTLSEQTWNLTRNTKDALKKLKDIGDKSAHSRRFIAHREDIDKVAGHIRVATQELIYLANLK